MPGSSLVLRDRTLLFTSAGMVQFKPYFLGMESPPASRLATCQKCFRMSDLEAVGDNRHLSFFEMLGNFSIGDYFKKEAIAWAWEFVTRHLKLPGERLWATIYLDDEEAFAHWKKVGVPEGRIRRFGEEDNFWGPVGGEGPCGPCSEIHFDFGEEYGCGRPDCQPNCKEPDCLRFLEIWNLVFVQFNQDREKRRTPLARKHIDTGAGLERLAAALAGKPSVYDTDLFQPLIELVSSLAGYKYGSDSQKDRACRIVAEHARGIAFLLADGVVPSNEWQGYVLRKLLRRASLFGRLWLRLKEPFLFGLAQKVSDMLGLVYPELRGENLPVLKVVRWEEERFLRTLEAGLELLGEVLEQAEIGEKKAIPGEVAFQLHDTYGFPLELTQELARERGLEVDLAGFEREMEKQRERARAAQKFGLGEKKAHAVGAPPTGFVGYEELSHRSVVVGLANSEEQELERAEAGQEVDIFLLETPFYGEMGGQVGDTGEIVGEDGRAEISQALWLGDAIAHRGKVVEGSISLNQDVDARVDAERRLDIARNHTATHLLQAALRKVLGTHVRQKGSLVAPDRLRFDFTHLEAPSPEELRQVESIVNSYIRANLPVTSRTMPYREALERGAIALFEEKYGEQVRALVIGDPPVSMELCGGTHVKATGEIGFFLITSEASIGSGLRRIEALTGRGAEDYVKQCLSILGQAGQCVGATTEELLKKIDGLKQDLEKERKRALALERELQHHMAQELLSRVETVNGVNLLSAKVRASRQEALREMGDILRDKIKSGVVVLGAVIDERPSFLAMVTPDLVARGLHAGEIVKAVAQVTGGGGGGRPEMAQAGGKDRDKLDQALQLPRKLLQKLA